VVSTSRQVPRPIRPWKSYRKEHPLRRSTIEDLIPLKI
jgi:hypothetical protein